MRKKGFTLIELLIVIFILIVLAGLIYAVGFNVKRSTERDRCVYNLRQIGMSLNMYAQDYEGFVPPYTNHLLRENYHDNSGKEHWMDTRPFANPLLMESAFKPYTRDKRIWFCPQDPNAGKDVVAGGKQRKFTSYDISFWIPLLSPVLLDHPPSDTLPPWMADPAYKARPTLYTDLWKEESKIYASDRHHELTNGVWLELTFEGHVVKRKVTQRGTE
jgi:prepilin-type N-terminal cleavage/methylation domain-containing protein